MATGIGCGDAGTGIPCNRARRAFGALALGLATLAVALTTLARDADAQRRAPPPSQEALQYSYAPVVREAAPAVVNVFVKARVRTMVSPFADDPIFRRFFGERFGMPTERVQNALGSGVIVSAAGLVVTNTHVVKSGGEAEIRVVLADKREFNARIIQQDDKTDIAVLQIDDDGPFPFLELADSDALEVGDIVLAIGNPFGVGQTVTNGIISALARSQVGRSDASVFIQTDAAINPGNSGGALVDMQGRLVGINTAIYSRSGGSQGIGFAIPSNLVKLYVESAATGRKVVTPWLGARLETVSREIAESLGLGRVSGALVSSVTRTSPAARAGLRTGDVIIAIDGTEVNDPRAVRYRLTTRGIGNTSRVEVLRDGRRITVDLDLRAAPEPGPDDVRNLAGNHPLDGARVVNLLPGVADQLGLDEGQGVVIAAVMPGSVAQSVGLRPGDIVAEVSNRAITSIADLEQALASAPRFWDIEIKRGRRMLRLRVPA